MNKEMAMPHRTLNVVTFSCSSAESWEKKSKQKNSHKLSSVAVSLQADMIVTDNYCFASHYSKNTMYLFFFPFPQQKLGQVHENDISFCIGFIERIICKHLRSKQRSYHTRYDF